MRLAAVGDRGGGERWCRRAMAGVASRLPRSLLGCIVSEDRGKWKGGLWEKIDARLVNSAAAATPEAVGEM